MGLDKTESCRAAVLLLLSLVEQVGEDLGRAEALGIARDLRLGSRVADWWLPQLQPAGR